PCARDASPCPRARPTPSRGRPRSPRAPATGSARALGGRAPRRAGDAWLGLLRARRLLGCRLPRGRLPRGRLLAGSLRQPVDPALEPPDVVLGGDAERGDLR